MKLAVFGQYYQSSTETVVTRVMSYLQAKQIKIIIEAQFYESIKHLLNSRFETFSHHSELDESITALVSIGGDGTILRAVTYVRNKNIPIVGINAGRLGFLATVQTENIEPLLENVISGNFSVSKRALLNLQCFPENKAFSDWNFALNEISVARKDSTSMITVETKLNGEYLTNYWADGLIISTPTGSTGYSLSCGGPILTPEVNSLVITPIAPHNLNARPLVIPDDVEVSLKISGRESEYLIALDSRIASVPNDTVLHIKKADFHINLIEFKEEGFLKTIRQKLLWGEDRRN